jgi:2-dehydro-3-deoxyphosphogluconate aldolase/(4S)-4-hydroxy-2-oxoglutarate aldolase
MTPEHASELNARVCALAPVIPVLVVDDAASAADLARALVAGGLPALEVTLRTPAALEAIREMARVEGGVVGAGTLLTEKDVEAAKEAGATFGVSPGATRACWTPARPTTCPFSPALRRRPRPWRSWSGAIRSRSSFRPRGMVACLCSRPGGRPSAGPVLPTGGVSLANARDYLSLPNVLCVAGAGSPPPGWCAPATGRDHPARARGCGAARGV